MIGCVRAQHPSCPPPWPLPRPTGNVCKHRLFVLLRVLHLSPQEPLVWQQALLGSEADEVRWGGGVRLHRAAAGCACSLGLAKQPRPLPCCF